MRYLNHILIITQLKSYMGNMFKFFKSHVSAVFMTHAGKHTKKLILCIYTMTMLANFLIISYCWTNSLVEWSPTICVCVCVCLIVCDRPTSTLRWPRSELGCSALKKKWNRNLWLYRVNESNDDNNNNNKGKAVPLQAWSGPEGSRKLRFPEYMTTAQDDSKVVSLTHRSPLPPGNAPGTHFC